MSALRLPDPEATARFGARLCEAVLQATRGPAHDAAVIIYLAGDLGAGKTTLARSYLRRLGVTGAVRSPTYTLVEPYAPAGQGGLAASDDGAEPSVFHLDLYRVADADELEYLGMRDMLTPGRVLLVEWPERGAGFLPPPTVTVTLDHDGDGRLVRVTAGAEPGPAIVRALEAAGEA